jgi:hypothetical protein
VCDVILVVKNERGKNDRLRTKSGWWIDLLDTV